MIYRSPKELEEEIKAVIADCLGSEVGTNGDIQSIFYALGKIALFIERAEVVLDNEDDDELIPESEYQSIRKQIEKRFPNWGYYNQCGDISINIGDTTVTVVDAIDDMTDIICELQQVLWVFDNQSSNNAMWHLNDGYMFNWRAHLLNLKLYQDALFNER